jgi:hypothetical protein
MIRPPPTSPSLTTGQDPAPTPHSFGADERRPAAVTRLRTAADAGKPRVTGAAGRDRSHAVGRAA